MNLYFTIEDMSHFLIKKGYKIGKKIGYRVVQNGPVEEDVAEEILVALKQADVKPVAALYWAEEINPAFGLEKVFTAEMQKAMLKL